MNQSSLRIIPLGGLGEIGKNMMVYQYGDEYLVVDAGLMFPENDMLGVDYIIPDTQFLLNKGDKVRGIVITHGHEDHIGAIHHLLDIIQAPIYATPLTCGLLEVKLSRGGVMQKTSLITVKAGEVVQIGPFQVEFFHVCHSIPDGVGLGIQTPAGLIVHTGDYKFDQTPSDNWPTDFAELAEFSHRGVLALLSDSTNSVKAGWTPSERMIDEAFEKVFRQAKGRVIVASFASLVSRMQQVADVAGRHGRRLAFVGTSMIDNAKMARKLGYLEIPETTLVSIEQALNLPDGDVTIMCTGSQGEPSSILGRLSAGDYYLFDIKPGDTVILSSHSIPGNEETVYRTINRLFQLGANVLYEEIAPVHVSGHASQEEIKLMINLVRPKFFIPIHGEMRHLKQQGVIARQLGIPQENIAVVENGQVIEFTGGEMKLAERVAAADIFVDGSGVGDVNTEIVREREMLSRGGVVLVNLLVDKFSGALQKDADISSYGFILDEQEYELLAKTRCVVAEAVKKTPLNSQKDVEQAVRTYLYSETHRRPVIFVTVNRV